MSVSNAKKELRLLNKEELEIIKKTKEFLEERLLIPVDVVFNNDTLREEVLKNGYKID